MTSATKNSKFSKAFGFLKRKQQAKEVRKINKWVLGETLGMGGYSKVKLGVHEEKGIKAALKIMFADSDSGKISASKKRQLTRELKVMEKVKHPNVVQLVEYDENAMYPENGGQQTPCILVVLEFAPGGELFDYLMFTGRFDEKATRTYFHQLIDGLEAIHSVGIAHRDLKPENLLLDSECNLKIADFGFATEFQTDDGLEKKMQTACGTKGYLAPELLKGKKYNHKCDIFAVGIIMFTTFAGFPPFQNAVDTDWWWDKLSKGWKYLEQAKRMQKEKDIVKHNNAGNAKKELFWKAHERTVQFPSDFKYLIEYTLHPMPSCRLDIKDIRADKWFKGDKYSQKQLKQYLDKRVATVAKERVTKIKKQLAEHVDNQSEYFTRPVVGNKMTPMQKRAAELDPLNEFVKNMEHQDDEMFVKTLYKFETKCIPAEIAARIERVADSVLAKSSISPKKNLTVVRLQVNFQESINNGSDDAYDETVTFAVKQFLTDEKDYDEMIKVKKNLVKEDEKKDNKNKLEYKYNKKYVVYFKRLQGSHQAYKKAVEEFFYSPHVTAAMILKDEKK